MIMVKFKIENMQFVVGNYELACNDTLLDFFYIKVI